jgi:hypothetical protein
MLELERFVFEHRKRFSFEDSHIFAISFAKVARRWRFLQIICGRYREACRAYIDNHEEFRRRTWKSGEVHCLTEEEVELYSKGAQIGTILQLEIESFYLFAKILLDETEHAIENYFGQARRLPIKSHDDLAKKIDAYTTAHGLCVAQDLRMALSDLKNRIADFRDKQIAHEKSPRTMRGGLTWGPDGEVNAVSTRIFPKPGEEQVNSESLNTLMDAVDAYLRMVISFLETNAGKVRFKIVADQVVTA